MEKDQKKKLQKKVKDIFVKLFMVLIIIVVIFISYKFINGLQTIKISNEEHELYQYIADGIDADGRKITYSGDIEITGKNNITKLESKDQKVILDSVPVYYENKEDKVILPKNMAIVFPMENGLMRKVPSLSMVYKEYGDVYIQKEELNKKVNDAFLYDGNDLYFFLDNVVLNVNGQEYRLNPLSYVNAVYKGYVEIFNYDKEEYTFIESVNEEAEFSVKADKYTINLNEDTIQYAGKNQILLQKIKNLPNFEN